LCRRPLALHGLHLITLHIEAPGPRGAPERYGGGDLVKRFVLGLWHEDGYEDDGDNQDDDED